ncbi:hypothetical protein CN189_24960, partial [Sinorhizobium meliloti]
MYQWEHSVGLGRGPYARLLLTIGRTRSPAADSDEAAPLFRDDCAPGFRDDLAPCLVGSAGD